MILCTETDSEHIKLMNLARDNIRVGEYLTRLPPLELLRERLHRRNLNRIGLVGVIAFASL